MATKRDVRFIVSVKRHDSCFVIEARPVEMDGEYVRNITDSSYDPDPLADLVVAAQGSPDLDDLPDTYGWGVEYHETFRVSRERAEVMVKMLRRVERGMAALESLGRPESFAAYLIRVGKVLGVSSFGYRVNDRSQGWSHDDQEYRWMDASGIQYWIDSAVRKLYEREEAAR